LLLLQGWGGGTGAGNLTGCWGITGQTPEIL